MFECEKWVVHVDLFFFQAEDGIRDSPVTGVQTCALPILLGRIRAQNVFNKLVCVVSYPNMDATAGAIHQPDATPKAMAVSPRVASEILGNFLIPI